MLHAGCKAVCSHLSPLAQHSILGAGHALLGVLQASSYAQQQVLQAVQRASQVPNTPPALPCSSPGVSGMPCACSKPKTWPCSAAGLGSEACQIREVCWTLTMSGGPPSTMQRHAWAQPRTRAHSLGVAVVSSTPKRQGRLEPWEQHTTEAAHNVR